MSQWNIEQRIYDNDNDILWLGSKYDLDQKRNYFKMQSCTADRHIDKVEKQSIIMCGCNLVGCNAVWVQSRWNHNTEGRNIQYINFFRLQNITFKKNIIIIFYCVLL